MDQAGAVGRHAERSVRELISRLGLAVIGATGGPPVLILDARRAMGARTTEGTGNE